MVNFWLGLLVGLAGLMGLWHYHQRAHSQCQKRLRQANQTLQDVKQERDTLIQQYQKATQCLQELEQEYQVALARLQALETENQSYQQQVQQLEQNYQRLQMDYQSACTRVQALERENQKLQTDCMNFQQYAEGVDATNQQLQQQIQNQQGQQQQLRDQLSALEIENQRLKQQVHTLQRQGWESHYLAPGTPTSHGRPIILKATEPDLYPDEIYETILSILKAHLQGLPSDFRRRQHILQNLLDCNPTAGHREAIQERLRSIFANYRRMNKRVERGLAELGFELQEHVNNHHKIAWQGDSRYIFSFATTAGDWRAGDNITRDLIRLLF